MGYRIRRQAQEGAVQRQEDNNCFPMLSRSLIRKIIGSKLITIVNDGYIAIGVEKVKGV